MASLRKFKSSKFYYACYTLPNGKRRQVSTGLEDQSEAMEFALKLERESKAAKTKGTYTQRQARKALQEIASSIGGKAFDDESVKDFFERHLKTPRDEAARTQKRRRQVLEDFLSHLGERAQEPLEYLETKDVKTWMHKQVERGITRNTANMLLSYINQAMKDAKSEGLMNNLVTEGCRFPKAKKHAKSRKHFDLKQFKKLLQVTEGEWNTLILIAALTGQRQKDCSKLKWGQVDFEKNIITFRRSKNNDEWAVPMVPMLADHLRSIFKRAPMEYIMPEMASKPATGRESISDVFRNTVLPKIGIKQPYGKKKGAGRQVSDYGFHCLRHSCSTWLAESGVQESDYMRFVGHEDKTVSRSYTHATSEQGKRTLRQFSDHLAQALGV